MTKKKKTCGKKTGGWPSLNLPPKSKLSPLNFWRSAAEQVAVVDLTVTNSNPPRNGGRSKAPFSLPYFRAVGINFLVA